MNINQTLYARRQRRNRLFMLLSLCATAFGLFFLALILYALFSKGVANFNWSIFTDNLSAPCSGNHCDTGGLKNVIVGSLMITFFALVIGTPIGMLCGIYLAEFGRHSLFAKTTRFINDLLLSAPSIIIGVFVWGLMVKPQLPGYSGWAGSVALSLLVIPVVVRTTENMLNLVPDRLREAAYALGTPKWKLTLNVTLKAAKTGVLTGIILAFARISGETSPLLFTALNNQFFSTDMSRPMANLPVMIFNSALGAYQNLIDLAWAAAFLITLAVLIANITARYLSGKHL
ncbi:phosphate ABC transporter permease PstA [Suttonella ornithocola]|uniref:Phosphate transport system permease protein PstA n=3 Tax=Suttonella ornithocola TaxID=279832 RepID=A0A380MZ17_9GAMM|nr:phosphate ABC transporter permease PstA [Suttonella ornithocola]SUO97143.1 Phosphate transport system permease protein pstA [Suttonella ornithocola]